VASSAGHHEALIASAKPARCQRITVSGLTTANAASVVGASRDSQTNNRRSALLRVGLFGDLRLSTLICWRRTKISASRRALDWNSPMSAPQSNPSSWIIAQQHHPIRTGSPAIWGFRQGQRIEEPTAEKYLPT
jgi:hypothetical protein